MTRTIDYPGTVKARDYFGRLGDTKTLLIVEDTQSQFTGISQQIREFWPKWNIQHTIGAEDTLRFLGQHAPNPPDLVSVDLGLEENDDPKIGLRLLQEIRGKHRGVPLAVHTMLRVPDEIVHQIIGLPASFVRIRDQDALVAYCAVLPYIARGFVFLSPTSAARLQGIISDFPDPLGDEDWKYLRLLAQQQPKKLTYREIAGLLHVTEGNVQTRVNVIAHRIQEKVPSGVLQIDFDESTESYKYRLELERFYNEYHTRYNR